MQIAKICELPLVDIDLYSIGIKPYSTAHFVFIGWICKAL